MAPKKKYIIYDMRACPEEFLPAKAIKLVEERQKLFGDGEAFKKMFFPGDTDEAAVLESCDSPREVEEAAGDYGEEACVFEYDFKNNTATNERFYGILTETGIFRDNVKV